jgi:hypothetical protein
MLHKLVLVPSQVWAKFIHQFLLHYPLFVVAAMPFLLTGKWCCPNCYWTVQIKAWKCGWFCPFQNLSKQGMASCTIVYFAA